MNKCKFKFKTIQVKEDQMVSNIGFKQSFVLELCS